MKKLYRLEIAVGVVAMILGIWVSALVWGVGYFLGALMLVVTGFLSVLFGIREARGSRSPAWQELFIKIFRRAMLFLNLMLSLLVAGTLLSML